jgi:acetyltransferase AlgX (SGNH hydrolase-like protein)
MGRAIPALLAVIFVADIAARFFSVDPLTFRAWEAVSRYRPPGAAFEPNRRYVRERSYGDAAAMGNLPHLRQYRREAFTTDPRGFRNVANTNDTAIQAILVGDSFAVGSGVADDATLSSVLSRRLGCGVYNAAGTPPDPDRLRALAEDLGLRRGVVVHAYGEDVEAPALPTSTKRAMNLGMAEVAASAGRAVGFARGFALVSPLRILSERAMKYLANDRVLPNSYASNVVRATLVNGDPMLFVASKLDYVRAPRAASADYWIWLRRELQKSSLDLLVVLVPSKYHVYRPLLVDLPAREDEDADFLNRLERALAHAGVPVINLLPTLSAAAANQAVHRSYVYWRDDIHWNSEGIRIAAGEIVQHGGLAVRPCVTLRATAAGRVSVH